ncbi:MAG: ATP-binding protein [Desulfobacula sp.]|jgi:two-component system sensor histidine kinase UhpB|nr:ATP-binding protein [Desulfobacula sp.]
MLDDLGLLPTLRWHLNSFTKRTDIAVNFETIALDDRMDATIETVLYRIAQESLNNIIKHADAKKVTVHLENKGKTIALTIEDDGKGFDVNEINARRAREKKIGLLGMEERTALMGGKFLIQSQKGHGTQIFVEIPLYARGI